MTRYEYLLPEAIGGRISWIRCRLFDRHGLFCRGRADHTADERARTT